MANKNTQSDAKQKQAELSDQQMNAVDGGVVPDDVPQAGVVPDDVP